MRKIIYLTIMLCFNCLLALAEQKVTDINITGTERIDVEAILAYAEIYRGHIINESTNNKIIKNLYNTGLFDDIKVNNLNGKINIQVVENPLIHTLSVEGNRRIKTEEIEKELSQTSHSILNKHKVQNDIEIIKKIYQLNSRYLATVEPKIIRKKTNIVNLVYEIDEGPKTVIRTIDFMGNNHVSNYKLKDVINSKEDKWYRFLTSSSRLDIEKLSYDKELVRNFYMNRGYIDVEVDEPVVQLSTKQKGFKVVYVVNEGKRYKLNNIEIENNIKNVNDEKLKKLLDLPLGKYYAQDLLLKKIQEINNYLSEHGFPFVNTDYEFDRDYEKSLVDVKLVIQPSAKFYVNQINITGNNRTIDKVIRREFKIIEGDPYQLSYIQKAENNLRDLDYFEEVEVSPTLNDKAHDRVDVNVNVKEKSTGKMNIAVGLSDVKGAIAKLGYNDHNLLGRGYNLDLTLSKTEKDNNIKFALNDPYFLDYRLNMGIELEDMRYEEDRSKDRNFTQKRSSGGINFDYELIDNLSYGGFYQYRRDKVSNVSDDTSPLLSMQTGVDYISAIGHGLVYNSLDSMKYPTRGVHAYLKQEYAGLGRGNKFLRHNFKFSYYRPVYRQDVVFSTSFRIGNITSISNNQIPLTERYFAETTNVRGFRTNGIGPREKATAQALGANNFYSAKLQLSFPLGLPKELDIKGIAFADAGSLFGLDYKNYSNSQALRKTVYDDKAIRSSVGTGFIWHSPIGMLGLSAAHVVSKKDYDKDKTIRFTIMSEL